LATTGIEAQVVPSLEVTEAVICQDVVDRAPVGAGTSFNASVGSLHCFTRIEGAHEPTAITHVWYYGKTERARIDLAVESGVWRTKSSKKIQLHETGKWISCLSIPKTDNLGKIWMAGFSLAPE
jgi:hypothetical protein